MTTSTFHKVFQFQHTAIAALLVASLTWFGCQRSDQIESYEVAKETPPQPNTAADAAGPPTHRMLAAIVPVGQQAWFFKAVAPLADIEQHAQAINDFYASVKSDASGRAVWQLPTGWKEDAGSGIRAATLWVPADGKPIEVSVTTLGWRNTPDDMLSNVNRWRGQMQLPNVDMTGLAECTREVAADSAKITLVDLQGRFQSGSMSAPFAGGFGGGAGGATGGAGGLPAGHPPIGATGGSDSAAASGNVPPAAPNTPRFDVPADWQQRQPSSSMRKAEFGIGSGQQSAVVTLLDFPADAGPNIADPLENVNRWRGEIGLGAVNEDGLSRVVENVEIDGQQATYTRAVPDPQQAGESQADRATIAAMIKHGDLIWFIKMTGSRELVAQQEESFRAFLKSMRFAANGGANNGNQ